MHTCEILPEVCYEYRSLSLEDVFIAYADKITVTGYVEEILLHEQIVSVRLGDNFIAHMPFSEATIYPIVYNPNSNNTIPEEIAYLYRKNIRIKITRLNGNFITVSRKASMLEAFSHLKSLKFATLHVTNTKHFTVFGDIGCGVKATISNNEICRTHIRSVREYLNTGDIIKVAVMDVDDANHFILSYKNTFTPYNTDDYYIGMTIQGKVGDWFKHHKQAGFYINITPQVSGIMNARSDIPYLKYGRIVECKVTGIGKRGLHLEFLRLV